MKNTFTLSEPQSEPKMSETFTNLRSSKESKGQNYVEFQLHFNVSCIL